MKVLNLYAGIGGNRKLWTKENTGLDLQITAVELDPNIAKIYQDFFPDDEVIVGDAHQYLLDHYKEFDFIWTSPPCPTHSRMNFLGNEQEGKSVKYPDMKLYQEVIYLTHWFKGKFCVENVISYYKPLIHPQEVAAHYFWANFYIRPIGGKFRNIKRVSKVQDHIDEKIKQYGFDSHDMIKGNKGQQIMNNCVHPELGLHIFNSMNNQELKLNL